MKEELKVTSFSSKGSYVVAKLNDGGSLMIPSSDFCGVNDPHKSVGELIQMSTMFTSVEYEINVGDIVFARKTRDPYWTKGTLCEIVGYGDYYIKNEKGVVEGACYLMPYNTDEEKS